MQNQTVGSENKDNQLPKRMDGLIKKIENLYVVLSEFIEFFFYPIFRVTCYSIVEFHNCKCWT